jgi:hypothetical protein
MDGEWYEAIVEDGYDYSVKHQSSIPFFPMYPTAAMLVRSCTGLSAGTSLLLVSNSAFALGCLALSGYLVGRAPSGTCSLLALGLAPTTFYFRMAYSESVFLLLALAAFCAMQRNGPAWVVAILCGAATATRAVGVALLPPFIMYLYDTNDTWRGRIVQALTYLPLACWGLLAFMAYQWVRFGTLFAFAHAQAPYDMRPWSPGATALLSVATLEPLWGVYDPSRPGFWAHFSPKCFPLFNLFFMNPLFFVGSILLVLLGAWRRWLTAKELLFSAGVLLVPYFAHSYPKCGASLGRYAVICFPIYIVLGRLLAAMGPNAAALTLSLSASLLCIYSALFSTWYWFY